MMDVIVLDQAEHTAHTANDASLLTVMDIVAAYDVASHILLQPAVILASAHSVPLHLSRTFHSLIGKIMVIVRIQIFSKTDTCAFAVGNIAILNDPALAPVRADHSILESGRRCPGSGCLANSKSTYRDVTDPCHRREEALSSHIDLYVLFIWILTLKIGIKNSFICFFILLGIPFIYRLLTYPAALVNLSL